MAVTIHVNGTSNSLVHKGSNGIAKNTMPDVCKTPSPGGPVPVPYPVIISISSDLDKGTKTIKVDSGNMAAVKGSEFSRCTGDEPGTAGGVKSSTNMKEATWLLYSFDVKLEGKNACRLTDKMLMNHGNTVCLAGVTQQPVPGEGIMILECEANWTDCQKKQMKAKAAEMDAIAKQRGSLQTRATAGRIRDAADTWAAKFGRDWNNPNPKGWQNFANPSKQTPHFYDDCAKTDDPKGQKMEADHLHEVQLGGRVEGPFRWLDREVNGASGRQIKRQRDEGITSPTGFQTKNC
jgi:hypothetical protein